MPPESPTHWILSPVSSSIFYKIFVFPSSDFICGAYRIYPILKSIVLVHYRYPVLFTASGRLLDTAFPSPFPPERSVHFLLKPNSRTPQGRKPRAAAATAAINRFFFISFSLQINYLLFYARHPSPLDGADHNTFTKYFCRNG